MQAKSNTPAAKNLKFVVRIVTVDHCHMDSLMQQSGPGLVIRAKPTRKTKNSVVDHGIMDGESCPYRRLGNHQQSAVRNQGRIIRDRTSVSLSSVMDG